MTILKCDDQNIFAIFNPLLSGNNFLLFFSFPSFQECLPWRQGSFLKVHNPLEVSTLDLKDVSILYQLLRSKKKKSKMKGGLSLGLMSRWKCQFLLYH